MKVETVLVMFLMPSIIYMIYSGTIVEKDVNKKAAWTVIVILLLLLIRLVNSG